MRAWIRGADGGDFSLPALRRRGEVQSCLQGPGEVVYTPGDMLHATVNMAETIAVAQQFCTSEEVDVMPEVPVFQPGPRSPAGMGMRGGMRGGPDAVEWDMREIRRIAAQRPCVTGAPATSGWDASHSDLQGTDHAFELVSAAVSEWSRSWSQKLEVAGSSPTPVTFFADGRDFAL